MGIEIQDGTKEYEWLASMWYTIEKKDLAAWYATGIN